MRKLFAIISLAVALAACGTSGPGTAGPLTLPSADPTPSVATTAPTTTQPAAPDTTAPTGAATDPTTSTTANTTDSTAPRSATITVYFLDDAGHAVATKRTVTTKEVAAAAIQALITGPTANEAADGLANAVPADSLLLGIRIADGTATVDMSREFEAGGGSSLILGRLAQLVYTLTEFDSVDQVQLLLDGQRVETFSGEGVVVGDPLTRADFAGSVTIGEGHGGSGVATWDQDDLPTVSPGSAEVYRVVLVAGDDVLNVRDEAGVDGAIIGKLLPGVAVRTTGSSEKVGSSTWVTVDTPAGPGWVNSFYLTRSVAEGEFPGGADPAAVVTELARRFENGQDITSLVSSKGLWVAHHATPIRFRGDKLPGLLDDTTTYRWGSNALEPGSPEITPATFSEAIAEPFVSTYDDPDRQLLVQQLIEGPNGRPVQFAIPIEFGGFPFVMVYDKGDNPEYGGLDWMSWIVSLAYEDGEIKVVGLTIDEWAP